MLLSINQISELTGQDRRTIVQQLDGLPFQPGDKNAYIYQSAEALQRVYAMDNLEAARDAQARSQASLNAVREEDLRKQRIPIQIVLGGLSVHRINAQSGERQKTDGGTYQRTIRKMARPPSKTKVVKDERQHADFLQVHRLVANQSGFDFRACHSPSAN